MFYNMTKWKNVEKLPQFRSFEVIKFWLPDFYNYKLYEESLCLCVFVTKFLRGKISHPITLETINLTSSELLQINFVPAPLSHQIFALSILNQLSKISD